jgi:hypothetical protein
LFVRLSIVFFLFLSEAEASGSKARAQLTAARDEAERLRRTAYDAAADSAELRAKLEAKRYRDNENTSLPPPWNSCKLAFSKPAGLGSVLAGERR